MISLRGVSKKFKLYASPADRLLEWASGRPRHRDFWALRDVDLEVPRGRTVGIVGANGAGKSTLLKIITGVLLPSAGRIEVRGRVAALLELGTGFHPEFTGRQNIHINGQLLGLSEEELRRLEPEIIEFSELGPFIDQPIRTYSSGMTMRLGFSIAAAARPEVLIVDEALSVGDARFSQKCTRRIREFRDAGTTILFVSHDPAAVSLLCDEAMLLHAGAAIARGRPKDILEEYNALMAAQGTGNVAMRIDRSAHPEGSEPRRHGTFGAVVSRIALHAADGRESAVFAPGDLLCVRMAIDFREDVDSPTVGFLIKDRLGMDVYGTNTTLKQAALGRFRAGETLELEARVRLALNFGDFSLTVAVHDDETHLERCYEWTDNAALFSIRHREKPDWTGMAVLDAEFEKR